LGRAVRSSSIAPGKNGRSWQLVFVEFGGVTTQAALAASGLTSFRHPAREAAR